VLETVAESIASHGVLGALLVVLGWRYHELAKELSKVQEARVRDAQKVSETHLAIQDQQLAVIGGLTEAVKRLRPGEDDGRDGPPTKPSRRTG
jgi:hypothetical protein